MTLPTLGTSKPILNHLRQQGYIALLAVIIISAVLLAVLAGLATQAALGRFNSLDRELKALSRYLAEACSAQALLRYAFDTDYGGGESIEIDDQSCEVQPIVANDATLEIIAAVTVTGLPTTLRSLIDITDLSIVSQMELIN